MAWEEKVAGPYLPPNVLSALQAEHNRLEQAGFPREELIRHSRWEEQLFSQYCPQNIVDQVIVDHEEYEDGNLRSRTVAR
jgi:hypothetical protein